MPASDDEIDYLLSGGGLSGQQLERIRGRLITTAARTHARARRRIMLAVTAAGAIAAAAAAVLILPRAPGDRETMRAKGAAASGARPSPVSLQVACLGGSLSACPRGSVLGFSVAGSEQPGFVTAFADPAEGAGGRLWYFVDQPLGRAAGGRRVLATGARVAGEHTARRYRIHMLLASRPLGRDRAAAAAVLSGPDLVARDVVDLEVVP